MSIVLIQYPQSWKRGIRNLEENAKGFLLSLLSKQNRERTILVLVPLLPHVLLSFADTMLMTNG
jgi:hypothetical protein